MLQRTLLSRPNLEKLISKTDLDLSAAGPSDRERLLQGLAQAIQVKPQTRNLFTITYRNTSPKLAHDVVQTLLSIFRRRRHRDEPHRHGECEALPRAPDLLL